MIKMLTLCSVSLLLFSCAGVMRAEENAVTSKEPPSAEEIAKWIQQLDSDSFVQRESAATALTKAGLTAVPQVTEAAQGESLEGSTRAFDILDKWISGEDQLVKLAAKGALEKLAGGEEGSKVVRRSKALLSKSNPTPSTGTNSRLSTVHVFGGGMGRAMPLPVVREGIARVELRAMAKMAAGVRGRSMKISIANGKKTIHVTEGDGLEVNIVEDKEVGIQIKVTEKDKDGEKKISKYAAKSLEELKEKHPEGHKVYEKYAGALNGLKIKLGEPEDPVILPR